MKAVASTGRVGVMRPAGRNFCSWPNWQTLQSMSSSVVFYHSWSPLVDVSVQVTSAQSASSATRTTTTRVRWSSVPSVTTGSMPSVRACRVSGHPASHFTCLWNGAVCVPSGPLQGTDASLFFWVILCLEGRDPFLLSVNLWWPLIQTNQCLQIFDS